MKKSWLCGAVALLMAFACIGAGCDEKSSATSFDELKSDTVTEEEWVAAFSAENFVNVSVEFEVEDRSHYFERADDYVYELSSKWDRIGTYTIKQTNDAYSFILSQCRVERKEDEDSEIRVKEGDLACWKELGGAPFSDGMPTEMYVVEDEKVAYGYQWHGKYDDDDEGYSFSATELKDGYGASDAIYGLIWADLLKTMYSESSYSEELQGYLINYEDEAEFVVKFQNKKVSAVKGIDGSLDDEAYGKSERYSFINYTYILYDYGKTTVELPKEFQDKIAEYKELHK